MTQPLPPASESGKSARHSAIRTGDRVLAFEAGTGERHPLVLDGTGTRKHKGLGVLDPDRWAGQPWGTRLRIGDKDVALLPPTLADLTATAARKAAVILPKDASRITFELGV